MRERRTNNENTSAVLAHIVVCYLQVNALHKNKMSWNGLVDLVTEIVYSLSQNEHQISNFPVEMGHNNKKINMSKGIQNIKSSNQSCRVICTCSVSCVTRKFELLSFLNFMQIKHFMTQSSTMAFNHMQIRFWITYYHKRLYWSANQQKSRYITVCLI